MHGFIEVLSNVSPSNCKGEEEKITRIMFYFLLIKHGFIFMSCHKTQYQPSIHPEQVLPSYTLCIF